MSADCPGWRLVGTRWLKFNLVGGIGIGVQLAVLALLKGRLHLDTVAATALAVEATVIHNYLWHGRFTWLERTASAGFVRFIKFNVSTGAVSMLGNVLFTKVLADLWHVPYLLANIIAIALCSIANFLVSDKLVFRSGSVLEFEPGTPKHRL